MNFRLRNIDKSGCHFESHFVEAIDHTFYGFTGVITHFGCWENTRKAQITSRRRVIYKFFVFVLRTSQVGYYAGKPIESVIYCLNNHRAVILAG